MLPLHEKIGCKLTSLILALNNILILLKYYEIDISDKQTKLEIDKAFDHIIEFFKSNIQWLNNDSVIVRNGSYKVIWGSGIHSQWSNLIDLAYEKFYKVEYNHDMMPNKFDNIAKTVFETMAASNYESCKKMFEDGQIVEYCPSQKDIDLKTNQNT